MNTEMKFNGERLKEAVQLRAMRLSDLSTETGISKQSLSLYANGENNPPFENVEIIAKVLRFPMEFFLVKDKCSTTTGNTYFRSQASATKLLQNAQRKKLEYVAKMYEVLLGYVDFPRLNVPKVAVNMNESAFDADSQETMDEIEHLAAETRKQWGIDDGPIKNLQYIVESKGIILTGFQEKDKRVDAFSQYVHVENADPVFIIALALGDKPMERLRFDISHELGHILMHNWGESNENLEKDEFNAREKQANMFASAFLMPKDSFGRAVAPYATNLEFYRSLKKQWGVSMQAMIYRAWKLDIITANQFQYLMRQISKKGWRTHEPGDHKGQLNSTIFQGAIDVLYDEGVLTPKTMVSAFKDYGVIMYENDLEDLMCLKEGTLRSKDQQILQFRLKNNTE